jgi:hypothetical protein
VSTLIVIYSPEVFLAALAIGGLAGFSAAMALRQTRAERDAKASRGEGRPIYSLGDIVGRHAPDGSLVFDPGIEVKLSTRDELPQAPGGDAKSGGEG